jgi:hypothetical protein
MARDERELMLAGGVTFSQEMIRTLQAGAIEGCNFLPERLADKTFGTDIASLRGKSKRKKPLPAPDTSFEIQPIRQRQWLYMDLFFICGFAFLISVSKPLDLVKVSYLRTGKKKVGVSKGILSHLSS